MRRRALPVVVVVCAAALVVPALPGAAGAPPARGPHGTAAAAGVALSPCVNPDNGDPELTGLAVLTSRVSTAASDARVPVRVTAHDTGGPGAPSGIDRIMVLASSPTWGRYRRRSCPWRRTARG